MAHKTLKDGRKVVDWTTGDPEGDRITLLSAYRDFIQELQIVEQGDPATTRDELTKLLDRWSINSQAQIDEVPRVWIKRPE